MKNQLKALIITTTFLLQVSFAYAGLDWTYGALTNPDNLGRNAKAVAYSTSGIVFVTGIEESSNGNRLIVTRKFSSTGVLLATVTNTYFIQAGTIINDNTTAIKLDPNDNVYVLGRQYGSSSRGYDVVLIKYSSSLTQLWKKLIYNTNQPNNFNDKPCKILLDANADIYVTGTWNNITATGFSEQIFVQKYTSAGTLSFSTVIPQATGKLIEDVTDMCIDNSLNITVCARAKDANDIYSIMYARIAGGSGGLLWKKFYSPSSTFSRLHSAQVECLSTGNIFLSTISYRETSGNNTYVRVATAKFTIVGNQVWENISTEVHEYADNIIMRLDASGNIYTGCDFLNSPAPTYKNHRIYKLNSAGTTQWIYTSAETSNFFSFETYASSSLFIIFDYTLAINPILRKLDASNGTVVWSETVSYSAPATYHHCEVIHSNIAVNSSTSEVAFCGFISADKMSPSYNEEFRWLVKKYGATSPRLSSADITSQNTNKNLTVQVFPNPSTDVINVLLPDNITKGHIRIVDINGKLIREDVIGGDVAHYAISVKDLLNGIYFIQIASEGLTETQKIIVQH